MKNKWGRSLLLVGLGLVAGLVLSLAFSRAVFARHMMLPGLYAMPYSRWDEDAERVMPGPCDDDEMPWAGRGMRMPGRYPAAFGLFGPRLLAGGVFLLPVLGLAALAAGLAMMWKSRGRVVEVVSSEKPAPEEPAPPPEEEKESE